MPCFKLPKAVRSVTVIITSQQRIFSPQGYIIRSRLIKRPRHYSHIQRDGETYIQPKSSPHKATGPDQIKPIILKNLSTALSPILNHLFQKSFDTGTVPPTWKDANVALVYKKGERSNPANYRLISLLVFVVKH